MKRRREICIRCHRLEPCPYDPRFGRCGRKHDEASYTLMDSDTFAKMDIPERCEMIVEYSITEWNGKAG